MKQNRERELWNYIDWLTFILSGVAIALLGISYFAIGATSIIAEVQEFLRGLILNLIPVLLVFVISYLLFRHIQITRTEHETDKLVEKMSRSLQDSLPQAVADKIEESSASEHLLIRNADNQIVYLMDINGLMRPIRDEDTVRYFAEMLGYQFEQLPQANADLIKPIGPEVTKLLRWSAPRTKEDEMSSEARRWMNLLRRRVRADNKTRTLTFDVRNNGEHPIQIISAQLVLNTGAPLAVTDISAENSPSALGLITCKLLFNGDSASRELAPKEEATMDLFLVRNLTKDEAATLETLNFGYIAVTGTYRETSIKFHLPI